MENEKSADHASKVGKQGQDMVEDDQWKLSLSAEECWRWALVVEPNDGRALQESRTDQSKHWQVSENGVWLFVFCLPTKQVVQVPKLFVLVVHLVEHDDSIHT